MRWAVFYAKYSDWSDNTILKNIYSLEDFGKPSEIADTCNYIDSKAAVLLLRKAKDAGVVLSPEEISDVLSNVEGPIIGELVQLAMKKGHAFHYEEILDLDGMISDSLLSQVISDSLNKGVVFTPDQLVELRGEEDLDDYDYSEDPQEKKAGLLDLLGTYTVASYLNKKFFQKKPDKKGKKGPFDF